MVLGVVLAGSLLACGDDTGSTSGEPAATVTITETPVVTPTPSPSVEPTEVVSSSTPVESTAPPTDEVPRTYDAAMARFDELGQEPLPLMRFVTEDSDIYCVLDDKELPPACELGQKGGVPDPDACAEALSKKVGRIEMQGGHATPVCNTDTIRGDMPDVLIPGEVARSGDLQCLNDRGGVLCVSLSQAEGFFVRPGEYVVFNAG